MDILKENAENVFSVNPRNLKGNTTGFKQLKQAVKPLSDVKNIIFDKLCGLQDMNQKKLHAETSSKTSEEIQEYGHDDLFFFEDDVEDDYHDIIPRNLQLTDEDISRLVAVFDRRDFISTEKLKVKHDYLPVQEMPFRILDDDDNHLSLYSENHDPSDDIFDISF